jgi:hypothetical protein
MIDGQRKSTSEFFDRDETSNARIETRGGTVYWISQTDDDRVRWIVREHLESSETNTMVMMKCTNKESPDLGDKFRARLGSDVEIGKPFVLELTENETRIVTEAVEEIEIGTVPAMIFSF